MVGKPSILVPSPNVAEDHQTKNAMALVEKKAAILVKDTAARKLLVPTFLELVKEEDELNVLTQNIEKMQQKDAAIKIAEEILKLTD
jgi:UDP-N-acetylglucosamine--N-acetylmuramyl-(pentapeptide) pyrophosphoryl-undecaprenol N-acetylglucosamine transferase